MLLKDTPGVRELRQPQASRVGWVVVVPNVGDNVQDALGHVWHLFACSSFFAVTWGWECSTMSLQSSPVLAVPKLSTQSGPVGVMLYRGVRSRVDNEGVTFVAGPAEQQTIRLVPRYTSGNPTFLPNYQLFTSVADAHYRSCAFRCNH